MKFSTVKGPLFSLKQKTDFGLPSVRWRVLWLIKEKLNKSLFHIHKWCREEGKGLPVRQIIYAWSHTRSRGIGQGIMYHSPKVSVFCLIGLAKGSDFQWHRCRTALYVPKEFFTNLSFPVNVTPYYQPAHSLNQVEGCFDPQRRPPPSPPCHQMRSMVSVAVPLDQSSRSLKYQKAESTS